MSYKSGEQITWCPGCPNHGILTSFDKAVQELVDEGDVKKEEVCTVAGVGCHGKIHDYLELNGVYGIHGRVLPTCLGVKLGNPDLTVVGFAGDGDTFNEGMAHLIHNARYNADFTLVVHNNKIFALTTGQPTATTDKGFKTKSTPQGEPSQPANPLLLAIDAGASFVARTYAMEIKKTKEIMKQAVKHEGFAFVEVMQPCLIFHDAREYVKEHMYWAEHDPTKIGEALEKAREWDYNKTKKARIPMGVIYKTKKKTYEEKWPQLRAWWRKKRKTLSTKRLFKQFK